MLKRSLNLMVLYFSFLNCEGQLSVALQEPPTGIVQKNQLWNLTLINSGNQPIQVIINLSLVDVKDNQPVLTAASRPVLIAKGVKHLKVTDVSPVNYNYLQATYTRFAEVLLPVGAYRACYSIYAVDKDAVSVLSEDCVAIEVQPLSPPQLNIPSDSAQVETSYPQFTWLPPVPVTLFSDLNYDLIVTEVRPDQTPGNAIQENLPIYNMRRLTTLVNNYPASYKGLDTGKVYAWRIIAKSGESFAGQSEVWTFRVKTEKPETLKPIRGIYLELKDVDGYTGTAVINGNIVGIKYYSYDKTHASPVKFFDADGKLISEVNRTIEYGNNFLTFKLDHSFAKDVTYFIEITDHQQSRYRASFRLSK